MTRVGNRPPVTRLRWLAVCVLFAVGGLVLHAGALHNPFHFDDRHGIVDNYYIRDMGNIPAFFDPAQGRHMFSPSEPLAVHYRPLLLTTYTLNFALGGGSPVGFHLFQVALHVAGALLLLALGVRLGLAPPLAAGVGLLFLASPFHAEAVNYISARSSLQSGVLSLASLLAFVRARQGAGRARLGWLAGALLLAACALLTKEVAVTVPLMFVLYDLAYPPRHRDRPGVRWGLHGYGLDLGLMLCGLGYLIAAGHHRYFARILAGEAGPRGFGENLWLQARVLVEFLRMNLLPTGLSIVHDFPGQGATPTAVLCALLLAAITGAVLVFWRRRPLLAFGWGLFLLFLLPTTLLPMNTPLQESRAYGASAGLYLMAAALLAPLLQRARARRAAPVALGLVMVLFAAGTVARDAVWASDLALWSDAVRKAPGAFRAHANLGAAYHAAGKLDQAVASYRDAVALFGEEPSVRADLGGALMEQGRLEEARTELEAAVARSDFYAPAHFKYALLLARTGDTAGARTEYEEAIRQVPSYVEARVNLGILLARSGDPEAGAAQLEQALTYRPDEAPIYPNLMMMYVQAGKADRAADVYARARAHGAATDRMTDLFRALGGIPGP